MSSALQPAQPVESFRVDRFGDYIRVSSPTVAFIRARPTWKWEGYTIVQKGRYRGLEEFVRYLSDVEAKRLEVAIISGDIRCK